MKRVARGEADLGVSAHEGFYEGVRFEPCREDRLVVVASDRHPLAQARRVHFEDGLEYDFVVLDDTSAMQRFVNEKAIETGRGILSRMEVDNQPILLSLAARGVGIGAVSQKAITGSGIPGLAVLQIENPWAKRSLRLVFPENPDRSHARVEALKDFWLRRSAAPGDAAGRLRKNPVSSAVPACGIVCHAPGVFF